MFQLYCGRLARVNGKRRIDLSFSSLFRQREVTGWIHRSSINDSPSECLLRVSLLLKALTMKHKSVDYFRVSFIVYKSSISKMIFVKFRGNITIIKS